MAAAFRLSDSQRERGVVIGGDDLPPGSPAFIRVLPRAGEPAIALYDGRRGRQAALSRRQIPHVDLLVRVLTSVGHLSPFQESHNRDARSVPHGL